MIKPLKHYSLVILLAVLSLTTFSARAAESYIIFDDLTGYILGSKNPNAKLQIASLTKVATVTVVLDWAKLNRVDLNTTITVPAEALSAGGVNPAGLQVGDVVSLRDLIYCSLLASDNIAATTLAYHIGSRLPNPEKLDPIGNFVANMNALARQLGMRRTLFLNPTGMDSGSNAKPYSTVTDLGKLTRYAYREPGFAFYVEQVTRDVTIYRAEQQVSIRIQNTNQLLGQDGIDGVKTGRTGLAGDCLILSADKSPKVERKSETAVITTPRRVTVILLRSPDRFGEGLSLMRQGWRLYDQWDAGGRMAKRNELL